MIYVPPLDPDPDGSRQHAREALRGAIEQTVYYMRLRPGMIVTEVLIAACIDAVPARENRWAFQSLLARAEEVEP